MKILVTAGATREPIDEVRFLSNVSTGTTGAGIADALIAQGHEVTLLRGVGAATPSAVQDVEMFSSADDLRERLKRRLAGGTFDLAIMGAAVADYRPETTVAGKIGSDETRLTLSLVRNEKILPKLKSFSPRPLRVIGFKLTVAADESTKRTAVSAQFATGAVDAVVQNDLAEIRGAAVHPFWWYGAADAMPVKLEGVPALAAAVVEAWSGWRVSAEKPGAKSPARV